jgi:ABC-type glutathione transport system ATPase component
MIVVMDAGRVAECGPPQDLLANPNGLYSALARSARLGKTPQQPAVAGQHPQQQETDDSSPLPSDKRRNEPKMSLAWFLAPEPPSADGNVESASLADVAEPSSHAAPLSSNLGSNLGRGRVSEV